MFWFRVHILKTCSSHLQVLIYPCWGSLQTQALSHTGCLYDGCKCPSWKLSCCNSLFRGSIYLQFKETKARLFKTALLELSQIILTHYSSWQGIILQESDSMFKTAVLVFKSPFIEGLCYFAPFLKTKIHMRDICKGCFVQLRDSRWSI